MRIAVLLKEVPDTYGERKLDLETGMADRGATDAVLDEIGERAWRLPSPTPIKTQGPK